MHTIAWLGRALIGLYFVVMAIYNFKNRTHFIESLKAKHTKLPVPMWVLAVIVALEFLGGLSLITGYMEKLGAMYLILFCIFVSFVFHPFWKSKGHDAWKHLIVVMGNLAVIGGLLLLLSMRGYV